MPLYDYKCSDCGHKISKSSSIANRNIPCESPCENCEAEGTVSQVLGAVGICDPIRMGRTKPSAGFNEVLRGIQACSPGSNINIRD